MSLDEASWHSSSSDFPSDLPAQSGATHIGMFVAWAALNNLLSESMEEDFSEALIDLRRKLITPGAFAWQFMNGKFSELDLNQQGLSFASAYYKGGSSCFLADYERLAKETENSEYRMPDSWATYESIAKIIDSRYSSWLSAR
jgi:hypothetical protein